MNKIILFLCCLLTSPVSSLAQGDFDEIRLAAQERIAKIMKKKNVVGATVAVVSSEEILWIDHFGYADKENEHPVTGETLFGLGSVTKVFTSTAVLQLAEQGKLDLDKPLAQYLPSFQMMDNSDGVTPRNLLTHHSGLPSDIFKGMFSHQPEDYKRVLAYLKQEYMAGKPNQIRAYSNPGYSLLGHMLTEVSGLEYPEYIRQNILAPLAITNTRFNAMDSASKTYDGKGHIQQDVNLRDIPAGGLFSSSEEMAKFLQGVLSQSQHLLKKETFNQLLAQQHRDAVLNFSSRYALGWNMTSRPHAGDIYSHTGTTLYFNAAVAFSPKADIGVIILTNSARGGSVFREANKIIEQIAKSKGLPQAEARPEVDLGPKKRIPKNAADLEQYTGIYAAPGAYFEVYRKRKKLFMKLQGLRLELIPVADEQFIPKVILLRSIPIRLGGQRVQFENIDGYRVMTSIEEGSPKELVAAKYKVQAIPKSWAERVGDYEQINSLPGEIPFLKEFSIEKKEKLLVLSFKMLNDGQKIEMVLDIVNENRAKIAGLGRYAGQSIIYENGVIKAFGNELKKTHE